MASEESMRKAFAAWDKNGDGFIVSSEIRDVLAAAGVPAAKLDAMTKEIFEKTDANKDGKISFEEFSHAMVFAAIKK